ncbi:hypothetical protein N9W41_00415 [bacterium]|nr:hypothetical protein [bacterium]
MSNFSPNIRAARTSPTNSKPIPKKANGETTYADVLFNIIRNNLAFTYHSDSSIGTALKDPELGVIADKTLKPTMSSSPYKMTSVKITDSNSSRVTNSFNNCRHYVVRATCPKAVDPEDNPMTKLTRQIIDPDFDEWWINEIGNCVSPKKADLCEGSASGTLERLSVCVSDDLLIEKGVSKSHWNSSIN